MEKCKRTIVQVLESYDRSRERERLKVATKYYLIGLCMGLIIGVIIRGLFG